MRRGYSSSTRTPDDLNPSPRGIRAGQRIGRVASDHRPIGVHFTFEVRPSLADRLIGAIFCPACLCLRIHPTHLLVCPDRRRKVIHRAHR